MTRTSAHRMRNTSIRTRKMRGEDSLKGSRSRAMGCSAGRNSAPNMAQPRRNETMTPPQSAACGLLQHPQKVAMHGLVAGDDVALGEHRIAAVEVAHVAAGLAHDNGAGRHVPG